MLFERVLLSCVFVFFNMTAVAATKSAEKKEEKDQGTWKAAIPTAAEDSAQWQKLLPLLREKKMPYGELAAARNMLNYFSDLNSKEIAYQTIINLVDLGYPYTTRPLFMAGDIEPAPGTAFSKSYFFYKSLAERDKKMLKWSDSLLNKTDKEGFAKYWFYEALQSYGAGKLDEAIVHLKKALSLTTGQENLNLAKKEARTLARIYYQQKEFAKAFEIYESFLLKTNPITPGDWLEAAWSLYGLKRFSEALGFLYNLESQSVGSTLYLEKFVLRGLIYREYCLVRSVEQLEQSFNKDFGKIVEAIRLGEPLTADPVMVKIDHPETADYRQAHASLEELEKEQKRINTLSKDVRPLAEFLYSSEIAMLKRRKQSLENEALQVLARHLVILAESLRFLRFDVALERYNPEVVFQEESPQQPLLVDSTDEAQFRLHWRQFGDFWQDERLRLWGVMKNKCNP